MRLSKHPSRSGWWLTENGQFMIYRPRNRARQWRVTGKDSPSNHLIFQMRLAGRVFSTRRAASARLQDGLALLGEKPT